MDYSTIFSARASRYDDAQRQSPEIRKAELECFARLLDLQSGEKVLDAPAGNGVASRYLPVGCDYQALDPAPAFAAACRAQGLNTHCGSLRISGLGDSSFDVVGSLTGLHHETLRAEVYAEWWRLLRPGGRLLVMDVAAGSAVGNFLNGFVNRWNSQGHRGYFLDSEDEQALYAVGFVKVQVFCCEYFWRADSSAELLSFMRGLFGLDRQPPDALFAEELAAVLGARQEDHGYRVPWSLKVLSACKPLGFL